MHGHMNVKLSKLIVLFVLSVRYNQ